MSKYDEAMKLLRILKVKAYTQEERDLLEWIMEVVWRDNDMRNS